MARDVTTPGLILDGVTTLEWGTEGDMAGGTAAAGANGANYGYYVVTSFQQRPVLAFNEKLPNGNGITSSRVIGIDGIQWEITVRDDTRFAAPAVGSTVYLRDRAGMLGAFGFPTGSPKSTVAATVIEPRYQGGPKQAGERSITVEKLTLID